MSAAFLEKLYGIGLIPTKWNLGKLVERNMYSINSITRVTFDCNTEYIQLCAKLTNLRLAKGFSLPVSVCI